MDSRHGSRSRGKQTEPPTARYAALDELFKILPSLRKLHCDSCAREIHSTHRIHCMECEDIDLCVPCFTSGHELKDHKRTHAYTVFEKYAFPLFSNEWTAEEELNLIDAIAKVGYNNWSDVADQLSQTNPRTAEQCKQHYMETYVSCRTAPIPEFSKIVSVNPDFSRTQPTHFPKIPGFYAPASEGRNKNSRASTSAAAAHAAAINSALANDAKMSAAAAAKQSKKDNGAPAVIGYLPLRGDFDVEWDNDAELVLADMEFLPEDTPCETALKQRVLSIYNSKIDERIRRKKFILERNLLDTKALAAKEKQRTKEERDLWQALRPLERFQTEEEQRNLIHCLLEERRLRDRLEKLLEWRSYGLTTLEQAAAYDRERALREQSRSRAPGSQIVNASNSYIWTGGAPAASGPAGDKKSGSGSGAACPTLNASGNNKGISHLPGYNLLTENEKGLCEHLRLPPQHYLVIKKVLIKSSLEIQRKNGELSKEATLKMLSLDSSRASHLYDFFVNCNWINNTKINTKN